MNVSHDEYGPIDLDKLMAIHNEETEKRFDMVLKRSITDRYEMDEHLISKEENTAELSSPECVEDRSERSNIL